jgi:hypothetical protein
VKAVPQRVQAALAPTPGRGEETPTTRQFRNHNFELFTGGGDVRLLLFSFIFFRHSFIFLLSCSFFTPNFRRLNLFRFA